MYDSAFVYLEQAYKLNPLSAVVTQNLGLALHSLRRYDEAIVYIKKSTEIDASKPKVYYQLACSYALANKPDQAVEALKQAILKGYRSYENILNDPDLVQLKSHPEFQALMDKYVPGWKNR